MLFLCYFEILKNWLSSQAIGQCVRALGGICTVYLKSEYTPHISADI